MLVLWLLSSALLELTWAFATLRSPCRPSSTPRAPLALDAAVRVAEGVSKELLVRGTGRPIEAGDILAVDYAAYARGSVFAKNSKEQFVVKDGSLIRGWDAAVTSMQVGERARFTLAPEMAYGAAGVPPVIAPDSEVELDIKVLAWLGNQLRPETVFSKDLDVDPFVASTPESIQAEYEEMEARKQDKYQGNILQIYLRRLRNISFGFGGSGFFTSQVRVSSFLSLRLVTPEERGEGALVPEPEPHLPLHDHRGHRGLPDRDLLGRRQGEGLQLRRPRHSQSCRPSVRTSIVTQSDDVSVPFGSPLESLFLLFVTLECADFRL